MVTMVAAPSPGHSSPDSILARTFTNEQISQQMDEDHEAWRGIIGILMAIVFFGTTLATVVVWAISRWA